MTDLDSPKKNNDCYFYYYSTCAKGDTCTFRHEPSALGCETMCTYWKEGKCLNIHCNFRHMELRKNRKVIPCYWESQPVGCLKAHCPFLHQNPRPIQSSSERTSLSAGSSMNQQTERKVTAVDSLVVNFEEESDNESGPSYSPVKNNTRIVKVKTMEEIRLEEIQAESAAYYSCYDTTPVPYEIAGDTSGDEIRERIVHRMIVNHSKLLPERKVIIQPINTTTVRRKRLSNDDLANILGDESLRKKPKIVYQNKDGNFQVILNKRTKDNGISITIDENLDKQRIVKQKKLLDEANVDNIKIKTLAEIRAERNARKDGVLSQQENEEAEVSSTSEENYVPQNVLGTETQQGKIKIRRKLPLSEPEIESSKQEENKIIRSQVEILEEKLLEDELEGVFDDNFDDEDDFDITLKAEEDLLNEVDD